MSALYNEIEPFAAKWLGNLIAAGHIASGDVDARSISELRAADLMGRAQCHFFAGIGIWSHALRLAGWPDDRPVWTGSCPCQPFSSAGKGGGFDDDRHLWPTWFSLIRECRPPAIFGEQVASPDGLAWLDLVHADLEGAGYAVGAADLCAAGVGAPHIRQRLFFVAHASLSRRREGRAIRYRSGSRAAASARWTGLTNDEQARELGNADSLASGRDGGAVSRAQETNSGMRGSTHRSGPSGKDMGATRGFWRDAEWISCLDGKQRPAEPGTFPLAHGATARVGRLRAYGNAIVSEAAMTFIRAAMEAMS